jgi:hypothetical protein
MLQILKVIPARTEMNALITHKRQFKLVSCFQKQQLSVLCQNIDEVAVRIQVKTMVCLKMLLGQMQSNKSKANLRRIGSIAIQGGNQVKCKQM